MIRSFVAIPLSSEVLNGLEQAAQSLKELGLDGRRVRSAAMHLTLKFLGSVKLEFLQSVGPALDRVAGLTAPFRLTLGRADAFPRRAAPRVVIVDLLRSPALDGLRHAVEEALHDLGVPRDEREYRPHLTLMRLKSRRRRSRLQDWFQRELDVSGRSFRVSRFHVYQSILRPDGARYRVLETFQLG